MKTLLSLALATSLCFQIHQHAGHTTSVAASHPASKDDVQPVPESTNFNLPLKTTGGAQIWTDHRWRDGYRVQRNALTGHWRVIDPRNIRQAWGNKQQCLQWLDQNHPAVESSDPVHHVVLLHGLMRTASSMSPLEKQLAENGMDHSIRFCYASTRGSIGEHAAALRELLESIPPNQTFSFVGHSMGNIVVRHLIGDLNADGDPKGLLPRCHSMVMLGPPNQGATIAERLAPTKIFGWITGKGGMELGARWKQIEPNLATPPFPFHIIAGQINNPLPHPLVDGEGDLVVSVDEAKLDGAASFTVVPVLHSFLMDNQEVMDKTVDLLTTDS